MAKITHPPQLSHTENPKQVTFEDLKKPIACSACHPHSNHAPGECAFCDCDVDAIRRPLEVLIEEKKFDFGFKLLSHHRSMRAADSAFRKCCRKQPSKRAILLDRHTGERKQYDGHGTFSEPGTGPAVRHWMNPTEKVIE